MKRTLAMLLVMLGLVVTATAQDTYNQIDESGNVTQRRENANFNPFDNDTTKRNKEFPRGLHVWTVDRKFGDITPAEIDTMPYLYHKTTLNSGVHGEFNTLGNNYSARLNRIFIDRPEATPSTFTDVYSYVYKAPEQLHFTNTLSPITNLSYDNCGDKANGEDHLDAKFAVNAGRRVGVGFDLNYAYGRGYFSNQSTAHFGSTLYASYLGDRYQMHAIVSLYHQKASENGGITDDIFISHPESSEEDYAANEIPTVLQSNWNRNDNQHLFLTHRYSVGFYRKVKMTEEELMARRFASASKKEKEEKQQKRNAKDGKPEQDAPAGRPDGAKIAGAEPKKEKAPIDSTRIKIDNKEQLDSLLALEKQKEAEDSTMKKEYVPVTSFIHTLELNNYDRIYQAYKTPTKYYADSCHYEGPENRRDSIFDKTRHTQVKNTVAIALLEGFNKYVKSGLKIFAAHDLQQYTLPQVYEVPDSVETQPYTERFSEHNISIGAQLTKTQGSLLHYNLMGETWLIGEESGQVKLDANADVNIPLLGDTVQIAAHAYMHRLHPTFYQRHYHSKHFWWDNNDLEKEMRTRIEGRFSYPKTKTQLRVAVEEIQNYTYIGMSYDYTTQTRNLLSAKLMQKSSNINVLTAQLMQNFRLGILNWENIITYQSSSDKDVLPLPTLNAWTNLYLKFKIARVLSVELGADGTYFTKYYAPDFIPALNQFGIQQTEESRIELGEFPFVNVYANLHLKRARFFVMMTNVLSSVGNRMTFLTPHYPVNSQTLHFGVSWNFFN